MKLFPWITLALTLAFVTSLLVKSGQDLEGPTGMPLSDLGRLPVSDSGRTKPLDTFARSLLLKISGRQSYDAGGRQGPAIEWLLESWTHPEKADDFRVFRIDHPDVLSLVGFSDPGRTRFSWNELRPKMNEIVRQATLANDVPRKKQDPFQKHLVDLYSKLGAYDELLSMRVPYAAAPLLAGEEWSPLVVEDPHKPGAKQAKSGPSVESVRAILAAYQAGNSAEVRKAFGKYDEILRDGLPGPRRAAGYEVFFNRAEPFYQTSVLYVAAFLLGCFSLLLRPLSPQGWAPALAKAAMLVLTVSFLVHTVGLGSRIYLQGRPPVTNLYSSAVFIGWACVPIALIGEWLTRSGMLQLVAAMIGFSTLIVAHNLGSSGDTMEMMQAVLDSNFWLATHVVVVTIGYSATFLAGFLACFYVLTGVLTPLLRGEPMKALPKMIYGVICFASVTSFVGTVLGGIWADQSWGRFWGWDPKENGAAMIVVWNLLILHARWGGMVKDRGVAALAIVGNIVTSWSWFGTNMLGVGLHSYGFMDSAVFWIILFALVQLAIMGIALIPTKYWRSLKPGSDDGAPAPSPKPSSGGGRLKVAAARSME
jgi:ABC-type transport system involved in cytochrome c biogenesis permease subunit